MTDTVKAESKQNKLFTTRELVLTALMAVIIAVCSWISVPTEVPFTLQTFAVFLAVELLGGKNGFFAVLTYILLGVAGLPVYAEFTSGIGVLAGMTGGYIVGFLFIPLIFRLAEMIPAKKTAVRIVRDVLAMIVGLAVCYAFGTAWFIHVYTAQVESINIAGALKMCVTPFLLFDLGKMAAAVLIAERLRKYVKH